MFTDKEYERAIQANDPNTWSHVNDPNTYTINNTANQTLNTIQMSNSSSLNHNIVFHGPNGKEVGRFDFSGSELKFDGSADISAQVFIEWARRAFNDRALEDKRSVLKGVMDALVHESTGALYEDAEKLAILTCIQRVREIQESVEPPQEKSYYGDSLAKSMVATQQAVTQQINALGGQP